MTPIDSFFSPIGIELVDETQGCGFEIVQFVRDAVAGINQQHNVNRQTFERKGTDRLRNAVFVYHEVFGLQIRGELSH